MISHYKILISTLSFPIHGHSFLGVTMPRVGPGKTIVCGYENEVVFLSPALQNKKGGELHPKIR
jgi:hypothetical protein